MKLNQPGLFGGIGPMPTADPTHTAAAKMIQLVINFIHGEANSLAGSEERLSAGALAPCWAFAMCYASLLLVSHGDGVLQDADWVLKVDNLRKALKKVSQRWKIAGKFFLPLTCLRVGRQNMVLTTRLQKHTPNRSLSRFTTA